MNNIINIDKLPLKRNFAILKQESSHDKKGSNADGFNSNFLYLDDNNEKVIFQSLGPGLLTRLWETGFKWEDTLKFYIDDEIIPKYNLTIKDIFYSGDPAFPYPLVINDDYNSGASVSYIDIPYQKSIKITTKSDAYFHFEFYELFNKNISSWSKLGINSNILDVLKNTNRNPNKNISYSSSKTFNTLKSNDSILLLEIFDRSILNSVELKFKDIEYINKLNIIKDHGRAHQSKSSFNVKLKNKTNSLKIVKRYDVGNDNDQSTNISINGIECGNWLDYCLDKRYKWKNSEFIVDLKKLNYPTDLNIEINYTPRYEWMNYNEFYYWIYGDNVLIDSIDIGDLASEENHSYKINNQIWSGTQEYSYFHTDSISSKRNEILKNTNIIFFVDNLEEPIINAPIDLFFGIGSLGRFKNNSLLFGFNQLTNFMYNFFPIPFKSNLKIMLINNSDHQIEGLELKYSQNYINKEDSNYLYLRTSFNFSNDSSKDYNVLKSKNSGHVVGVINDYSNHDYIRYLESDDRIYIDNMKTPLIQGTGLEDFFNSGYYFNRGLISNPFNGIIDQRYSDRIMYRLFINDPIVFHNYIEMNFEKNGNFLSNTEVRSLVFYYSDLKPTILLTDSLIIGDKESENKHNYLATNAKSDVLSSSFEGTYDKFISTFKGNRLFNESLFKMDINSENEGVYLTRVFNYSIKNQKAEVFIDDVYAGIWFNPGFNDYIKFRDDVFFINSDLSKGKVKLNIKVKNIGESWSEFKYYANIITSKDLALIDSINSISIVNSISEFYPNPTSNYSQIEINDFLDIKVFNINGIEQNINYELNQNKVTIFLEELISGLYFVKIISEKGIYYKKLLVIKN